ncbi:hypothetical protein SEMRO_165_G074000.1 [Seminavis robusta]|uniref:Uncharacterized protein n=1 Tax=Seminavis robusta TaxID=568900 RepID=A0A9N8DIQ6_9STRA|nr:hypothetical protein SEMRO_165_G074000.1 [Seminavis robusta]|eukprot:Sro165_g074000.1 n/a (278) ;mRNA; r:101996-102829
MQEELLDPLKLVELRQRALAALAQGVDVDEVTDAYQQGVDVDHDNEPPVTAPTTAGRSEATENEMGSDRQKEEAPTQTTINTSISASVHGTRVERQERNFDILKVVEARARAATMTLSRVQHIDASEPAHNQDEIRPAVSSPRQTTIAQNESNFAGRKVVEEPFCDSLQNDQLSFFSKNDEKLEGHQPSVIKPTMGQVAQAVNQSAQPGANAGAAAVANQPALPGAYAGAPGEGLHRNSTVRFSLLGREAFFGSPSGTFYKSQSIEVANTSRYIRDR